MSEAGQLVIPSGTLGRAFQIPEGELARWLLHMEWYNADVETLTLIILYTVLVTANHAVCFTMLLLNAFDPFHLASYL